MGLYCFLSLQWRARLVEALKAINAGEFAEPAVKLNENSGGIVVSREEISPPKVYSLLHFGNLDSSPSPSPSEYGLEIVVG